MSMWHLERVVQIIDWWRWLNNFLTFKMSKQTFSEMFCHTSSRARGMMGRCDRSSGRRSTLVWPEVFPHIFNVSENINTHTSFNSLYSNIQMWISCNRLQQRDYKNVQTAAEWKDFSWIQTHFDMILTVWEIYADMYIVAELVHIK